MKTLTRSLARPGNPQYKINPETGKREFEKYLPYWPTDKGKHEKWALDEVVNKANDRLFSKPKITQFKTYTHIAGPAVRRGRDF